MTGIGVIGGTGFKQWESFHIKEELNLTTPWGTPSSPIYKGEVDDIEIFLLLRHGENHDIPPHQINYRANIYALQRKVEEVIGISSAGALKVDIEVPTTSIPIDYVNFWNVETFYDEKIKHITPELSERLRKELLKSGRNINGGLRDEDI